MGQMPTGGGKTIVMSDICYDAHRANRPVLIIAHRKELITQAQDKISKAAGIDTGIIMGDHRMNLDIPIQVCSIQTINSRLNKMADYLTRFKLVIVDEAHHIKASTYMSTIDACTNAKVLGLTATPWRSSGEGFKEITQTMIQGPSVKWLEANGYLVPARKFQVPLDPEEMKGWRVYGEKYRDADMMELMGRDDIMSDIVGSWKLHAQGRQTVTFAVNIAHSKKIVEMYQDHGISAAHLDGNTNKYDRDKILIGLENGKVTVLSNCGIVGEGVDVPVLGVVQIARPVFSLALFLQMCGRGSRTAKGKEDYILLDHGNNLITHGFPNRDHKWTIEDRKKRKKNEIEVDEDGQILEVKLQDEQGRLFDPVKFKESIPGMTLVEVTRDHSEMVIKKIAREIREKNWKPYSIWHQFKDWLIEKEDSRDPTTKELKLVEAEINKGLPAENKIKQRWRSHRISEMQDIRNGVKPKSHSNKIVLDGIRKGIRSRSNSSSYQGKRY